MALKTQNTLNILYNHQQQYPSTSKVLVETQDDLDEHDNEEDEGSGEDDDENEEDDEDEENEEESETDHSGSLLHSILTNVSLMGISGKHSQINRLLPVCLHIINTGGLHT